MCATVFRRGAHAKLVAARRSDVSGDAMERRPKREAAIMHQRDKK
jgi:hypothetical protein